jgi:uncharacterized protein YkvS
LRLFFAFLGGKKVAKIKRNIRNVAQVGDSVSFERKGHKHVGYVYKVNENSVLVEISKESQLFLGYENAKTVVAHQNYMILQKTMAVNG